MLSSLLDAPLIAGPLPTVIVGGGAAGGLLLLARRGRRWWTRTVPFAAAGGVATAALVALIVVVFRPFPDPLPVRILFWIAVTAAAIGLAWAHRRSRWWHRGVVVVAVVAVVATGLVKVNSFYGYRPTLGTVLGIPFADQIDLAALPRMESLIVAPPGEPLSAVWHPQAGQPVTGRIAEVPIPGRRSGFPARHAWIYLPPAYLGTRRAELPVLVLVPGQPGGPEDWLLAGRLTEVMDAFAAAHDGLAPVVVVPDSTGSAFGNPMCLDSRLGAAETYLAVDVPAWLADNLQVRAGDLAIGGFSFGGTCALQLALRRPHVYPTFLDISGQAEPTLGDHAQTVHDAFDGDEQAYAGANPLDELRVGRFTRTAGTIVAGQDDTEYRGDDERVAGALRAAGASVSLQELPGQHSWTMAAQALGDALPWISARAGLLPSPDPVRSP